LITDTSPKSQAQFVTSDTDASVNCTAPKLATEVNDATVGIQTEIVLENVSDEQELDTIRETVYNPLAV
jgi:hypothetical protein